MSHRKKRDPERVTDVVPESVRGVGKTGWAGSFSPLPPRKTPYDGACWDVCVTAEGRSSGLEVSKRMVKEQAQT